MSVYLLALLTLAQAESPAEDLWAQAQENGRRASRAILFCHRYAHGWLAHADPATGLTPRTLTGEAYWNAKDCAADNYPFMVLTAAITGDHHLWRTVEEILASEQGYANRQGALPDDFLFDRQGFRDGEPKLESIIFGAAEYAKDGLLPITEWCGPSPWMARMQELVREIWKYAGLDSPAGKLPSKNVEVNGDLLQVLSRLYWATGDETYKGWAFRLADFYLQHEDLLAAGTLRLRDHGSEIIGGLSEAYVIAQAKDPDRWRTYEPRMCAILDRVIEVGRNEDGMLYNVIDPATGKAVNPALSDGWGYVYPNVA